MERMARDRRRKRLSFQGFLENLDVDIAKAFDLLFWHSLFDELLLHLCNLGRADVLDKLGESLFLLFPIPSFMELANDILEHLEPGFF
jgi:hypothetical protein